MSPRKLSDESSATGKGMLSKVWLWPRKKISRRQKTARRGDHNLTRTKPGKAPAQSRSGGTDARYEWINVKRILLHKSEDQLDQKTVAGIAESILLFDLLHPIAVRRVGEKIVLVAGAHRLEAMKRLERKKILCYFVDREIDAQLVRLGEDLWRKTLSVLRRAEKLVEYFAIASAKVNFSGQPGQKSKLGRPSGGVSLAARELPLVGRTAEARRKIIDRAMKISQITREAKKAAIEAGLANNQAALLKVAKAAGWKAQLRKVAELAKISKKLSAPPSRAAKRSVTGGDIKEEVIQSPPLQPDAQRSATEAGTDGEEAGTRQPSQRTTTLEQMEAAWKENCRADWAYLPAYDRERFIEQIRRAKLKARVDVVKFIQDVFRGREKVSKQDLFGIAAMHGFASSTIRKALTSLGYRSKRKGHGIGAKWFVINPDRLWDKYLPAFSDAELTAAAEAQPDPRHTRVAKGGWKAIKAGDDYLKDVLD
jgi:ParB-like chromosome segregation protein Spo0J